MPKLLNIWKKVVAISVVIGVIFTLKSQINVIYDFLTKYSFSVVEHSLSYLLKIERYRYSKARKILEDQYNGRICIHEVLPWDLDMDGVANDLIVKHSFIENGLKCHQDQISLPPEVSIVHRYASKYQAPRLTDISDLKNYDLSKKSDFLFATSNVFDKTYILAYHSNQHDFKKITELNYRLTGEDSKNFKLHWDGNNYIIRSSDGYGLIYWSKSDNFYSYSQADHKTFKRKNTRSLLFNRNTKDSINNQSALEFDGERLIFESTNQINVNIGKYDQLVIDPLCKATSGFKEINDIVKTIMLDKSNNNAEVICQIDNSEFLVFFRSQ